jgi:hypothetical protein
MFKFRSVLALGLAFAAQLALSRSAEANWLRLSDMKSARNAFPFAVNSNNGNIYMLGGRYTAPGATTTTTEYTNLGVASPVFVQSGNMRYARSYMPAVQIQAAGGATSKFLLPGGFSSIYGTLRTAEIFDVATGTSVTTVSMGSYRELFDAVSLQRPASGYAGVLAIGGFVGPRTTLRTCELFDYSRGRWTSTASLNMSRYGTTSLLLPDGRVMAVGGRTESISPGAVSLSSVEYYTPAVGRTAASWKMSVDAAHSLRAARFRHTMTVLGYDTNNYPILLITGGYCGDNNSGQTINTAELGLYDPQAKQYTFQILCTDMDQTMPLGLSCASWGRMDHTATLLGSPSSNFSNRQVLIVGGWDGKTGAPGGTTIAKPDLLTITATVSNGVTVYTGSVEPLLDLPSDFMTRHEHTAIPITVAEGTPGALICGGFQVDANGNFSLKDAWIYTP